MMPLCLFSSLTLFLTSFSLCGEIAEIPHDIFLSVANAIDPNAAQKTIQLYAKGNPDAFIHYFRECLNEDHLPRNKDASKFLINVANAFAAWSWDAYANIIPDYENTTLETLRSYRFADTIFNSIQRLYKLGHPQLSNNAIAEKMAVIIGLALLDKQPFVLLVGTLTTQRHPDLHFGTAIKLEPLMRDGRVFPELKYLYGRALLNTSAHNKKFIYAGIKLMAESGCLQLSFVSGDPQLNGLSFAEEHCTRYQQSNTHLVCTEREGILFANNGYTIIPSHEHWDQLRLSFQASQKVTFEDLSICDGDDLKKIYEFYKKNSITVDASQDLFVKVFTNKNLYFTLSKKSDCSDVRLFQPKERLQLAPFFVKFCATIFRKSNSSQSIQNILDDLQFESYLDRISQSQK